MLFVGSRTRLAYVMNASPRFAFWAIAFTLLLTDGVATRADEKPREQFAISVDGKPCPTYSILPGVHGDPVAPGDCLYIDRYSLALGPESIQRFHTSSAEPDVLRLQRDDGRPTPIAAQVRLEYDPQQLKRGKFVPVAMNPLSALKPDEIRELRGLRLAAFTPELAKQLQHVDPDRIFIELACPDEQQSEASRALPAGLRRLSIRDTDDPTAIGRLRALEDLILNVSNAKLTLAQFRLPATLRRLRVGTSVTGLEATKSLTELRVLSVAMHQELRNVAFAANLRKLRRLDVSYCGVTDLGPLAGHPALEQIDAGATPLETLPLDRPLPALRSLNILDTRVSDADVQAFQRLNPQCHVARRYGVVLRAALAGADRVRVTDAAGDRTLAMETDRAQVQRLIENIEIDEHESGGACNCDGHPALEFYHGEDQLGVLYYHHDLTLRWRGWPAWPQHGLMTKAQ